MDRGKLIRLWCLRKARDIALWRLEFAYEHDPVNWPARRQKVDYYDRRIAALEAQP